MKITFVYFSFLLVFLPGIVKAQCTAGYTAATLNWDNLDYLHNRGSYYSGTNPVTSLPFVSTAMWQTQKFAIGTNQLTINTVIPVGGSGTVWGDVATHTGNAGGFAGADVHYVPTTNGQTITMTYLNEVEKDSFTINDIDRSAVFTITATDAFGTAQTITVTTYAGTILSIGGTATSRTITATSTALGNTINTGAATIAVAGPVQTIIVTVTTIGSNAEFFLSDIKACIEDPGFPSNYYSSYTEPFTGQPAYFLANPQNLHVYMVNAATGVADYIFSDPGTVGNKMNSMAYDPVNKWLYYVMDNATQSSVNKALKKYDFNTETISTVLSDITTLGIPTFIQGVEYGGAAFYNSSLYLGIEESDGTSYNTNAESVIWKIDFDGSGTPTDATQVYGTPGDNGAGTVSHDWGDFVTKDGMIISHATNGSSSNNQYIHFNLQTGATTTYTGNAESAGQLGQTWNGNIYRIKNTVALYNNDGSIGSQTTVTTTSCSSAWAPNAGDGSDPFKPKCDFGDAPATYDPVALSPAVHQQSCNNSTLRLGSNWDREWSINSSSDASGDSTDEDGIATVTILVADGTPHNYVQAVSVLNNTGATVTLGGWLDYNVNGVFEASEGIIVTVPTSASVQDVYISWLNLTIAPGTSNTFLRIRLVSGTGTMTTSNPTGWYSDGEVEDYPVVTSNIPLTENHINFYAYVNSEKKVQLEWTIVTGDEDKGFEIQRSIDQNNWEKIGWTVIKHPDSNTNYSFLDLQPVAGNSYYRLKLVGKSGSSRFSITKRIHLEQDNSKIKILPNPVHSNAIISFTADKNTAATLRISTWTGQAVNTRSLELKDGENRIPVDASLLSPGVYLIELDLKDKRYISKMIIAR